MKIFRLMTGVAAGFIVFASCNSQNNLPVKTVDTTKAQQVGVMMKADTAKYTLAMVDNKRDFVCRMPLTAGIGDTVHYKGKVYGFCSKGCKESFLQDPKGYLAEKL